MIRKSSRATVTAVMYGCVVANQVRPTAATSSPTLSAALEKGSGDGVTATRAAVLPTWAAELVPTISPKMSWVVKCTVTPSSRLLRPSGMQRVEKDVELGIGFQGSEFRSTECFGVVDTIFYREASFGEGF